MPIINAEEKKMREELRKAEQEAEEIIKKAKKAARKILSRERINNLVQERMKSKLEEIERDVEEIKIRGRRIITMINNIPEENIDKLVEEILAEVFKYE